MHASLDDRMEDVGGDFDRVFATLIRLLGDFDLAEEALQDAFTAAVAGTTNTADAESCNGATSTTCALTLSNPVHTTGLLISLGEGVGFDQAR